MVNPKNIPFFFLLVINFFVATNAHGFGQGLKDNRPDAAPAVLSAFQGSCGSQGVFTQAANAQSQAIVNVIENLKNTDACKPFISELSTIQSAANSIQNLQSGASYANYQTDQQSYQLLTLALQNSKAGSAEAVSLQEAISTLRLQMYNDQATYNVSTQTSQHNVRVSQLSSMLSWGQQLTTTSTSPSLTQCLQQSPIAALELGTNLAAYGGSFLPGVFGAGVSVIGQLMSTGLETLRTGQYDEAIFAAQSSQMPDSLECALESMTESYCNADDSYTLLDLARKNRLPNYSSTPLWKGIDILSRQMPSLLQWLSQIQNEVPPQDSFQASKQNSVFQEIFEVQEQNLNSIAAINNALDQAQSASSDNAKSAAIVNMIAGLSIQLITPATTITGPNSFTSTPTPFSIYQSNPSLWACWIALGPQAVCPAVPPADQGISGTPGLAQLTDYIGNTLGLYNPAQLSVASSQLLNNWNKLVPNVQVLVNADFARIIATNAGIILSSARVSSNGAPLSPYQVLQNISSFLDGMIQYNSNNPELPLSLLQEKHKVDETIRQLTVSDAEACPAQLPKVLPTKSGTEEIPPTPIALTPEQCQVQRLVAIFNLFDLQNGTQVFLTDMNGLVNIDLQNRFANSEIGTTQSTILKASGQDLAVALQSAGIGDLDPIADDLDNARSDIEENIQVFRQFFVKGFQQAVQRESAYAANENAQDGANRPHGQRLGELCMLWLLSSNIPSSTNGTLANWPDDTTQSICTTTLYFNENSADPTNPSAFDIGKLEKQIGTLPFQKRACTFHRYKLQNKADTRFGITPPGTL